jgi:hypothetical protein
MRSIVTALAFTWMESRHDLTKGVDGKVRPRKGAGATIRQGNTQ